jgi:hypothetical protein
MRQDVKAAMTLVFETVNRVAADRTGKMSEPKTRGQVDDLIETEFPSAISYTSWIEREEPRRHISVRFGRGITFEGAGSTWTEAVSDVRRQQRSR